MKRKKSKNRFIIKVKRKKSKNRFFYVPVQSRFEREPCCWCVGTPCQCTAEAHDCFPLVSMRGTGSLTDIYKTKEGGQAQYYRLDLL